MEYKIVYGGQMWVTAADEEEAFLKFWQYLRVKTYRAEVGLIVESREAAGAGGGQA